MSRRFISWIGAITSALLLVACAGSVTHMEPRTAPAAEGDDTTAANQHAAATLTAVVPRLETVKVSIFPSMGFAGIFIGMKRGYFREESAAQQAGAAEL